MHTFSIRISSVNATKYFHFLITVGWVTSTIVTHNYDVSQISVTLIHKPIIVTNYLLNRIQFTKNMLAYIKTKKIVWKNHYLKIYLLKGLIWNHYNLTLKANMLDNNVLIKQIYTGWYEMFRRLRVWLHATIELPPSRSRS